MADFRDVQRLGSQDLVTAEGAFERLSKEVTRFLQKFLASWLSSDVDRDDVIAITLTRIWQHRSTFDARGLGAWWAYVAKIAKRLALDRLRQEDEGDLPDDLSDRDREAIDIFAERQDRLRSIFQAADELWLGIEKDLPHKLRQRRLLAAQLFYLHNRSWEETCRVVGGKEPLERQLLDEWLATPPVLLDLAKLYLYADNDRLASIMLNPSAPLSQEELEKWSVAAQSAGEETAPNGTPWRHVKVLILHYRNGLSKDKIAQMAPDIPVAEIEQVLRESEQHLPFAPRCRHLCANLHQRLCDAEILKDPGLWKRLVFSYHARCYLPQAHMFERTDPAAKVAKYHLTPGMINVWISNGRLISQLADYMERSR